MIIYFLLILLNIAHADPTWKWSNGLKIVEKHEFYMNEEIIIRPKDSWQTLFGVIYQDSNLKNKKDCLFYFVPGEAAGILKMKTIPVEKKCEEFLYLPGDQEWKNLKALQYSIKTNLISLSLTSQKYEIEKWEVPLLNIFEHPKPKGLMSSAEYRSPKVIYLTPYQGKLSVRPQSASPVPANSVCHEINEDCTEKSPSTCTQCQAGWYEIPNGCVQGPKFCGSIKCGTKNQPACRRGVRYQRQQKDYHCQEDHSFAYCAKGLSVECHGNLPYCL